MTAFWCGKVRTGDTKIASSSPNFSGSNAILCARQGYGAVGHHRIGGDWLKHIGAV